MEQEVKPQFRNELEVKTTGLLTSTKADIASIVKNAVSEVQDGNVDKIDAYIFAKKLETLGKDLAGKLKPIAETVPIGKTGLIKYNAEITEGMLGVKWDFSECGDYQYDELIAQINVYKEAIKNREDFLKTIIKPTEVYNPDTSEVYIVNPPVKSGALGITVKLK